MRARHWIAFTLLLTLPSVYADESDPPMELIEMLGEADEADIAIAMSEVEVQVNVNEKVAPPEEVKNDE
jgi:hypothetical protein